MPTILLADDHTLFLEALRAMLEPEFEVVGAVADGRSLVANYTRLNPDVVILDVALPLLGGLEAGRQLKAQRSDIKLIYLTMNEEPEVASAAFRLGASGYLLKTSSGHELKTAIREVLNGRSYITPLMTRAVVDSLCEERRTVDELTSRQREVLQLLAEGHSMKEVGAMLNVTPRTVAFHKYRMMHQLHVRSSAELVRFAVRQGLVD